MTYVHASDRLWHSRPARAQGLFARIAARIRDHRAQRELSELSPELLRDIGLVDQVRHDAPEPRSFVTPPTTWGGGW